MNAEGKQKLDRVAIALSGLCLLHCLAIPLAFLLGPVLSDALTSTETSVHWVLLGLAIPVSVVALTQGYRSHGNPFNLVLGLVGLAIMFVAVVHLLGETWEIPLTVVGVLMVLVAHVRNTINHMRHAA